MPLHPFALGLALVIGIAPASNAATRVAYSISIAGLPVGSGALVLEDQQGASRFRLDGSIGGVLGLGRFESTVSVARSATPRVSARAQWTGPLGAGEASASIAPSQGNAGRRTLRYDAGGKASLGPWNQVVRFEGSQAVVERQEFVEQPGARRSPIEDSHRKDVVSPLEIVSRLVQAETADDLERFCRERRSVFTGVTRFDLEGLGLEPLPTAPDPTTMRCRVRYVPVAGQRIDPGAPQAQPRLFEIDMVRRNGAGAGGWLPARVAFPSSFGAIVATAQSTDDKAPAIAAD